MKSRFVAMLLCLLAWSSMAAAQGFTLDYPRQWKLAFEPNRKDPKGAPTARLISKEDRIVATISWMSGRDASVLKPAELREVVNSMVGDAVAQSLEGKSTPVTYGKPDSGVYVRLTDRDPKTDAKYFTSAVYRNGSTLALGVLYSNDDDGAMLAQFLKVMQSLVPSTGQAAAPSGKGPAPTAAQPPAAEQWGAISVEVIAGDTDPYYGVGGGDTQAEAEANAQSYCREAGGKRCKVQVAYAKCGAVAVSKTASGTGIGDSEKSAAQQAMSACGGRGCTVVVADCN